MLKILAREGLNVAGVSQRVLERRNWHRSRKRVPEELFKRRTVRGEYDTDDDTLLRERRCNEYDEDALESINWSRLSVCLTAVDHEGTSHKCRYYYAIVTCDTSRYCRPYLLGT